MRVLIVEDEERLAQNLAKALTKSGGFAVDVALNGADGLHHALSGEFDAIVLDLMLPKLPGSSLLTRLRDEGHKTPVLVLTAIEDKNSTVTMLNSGADDYLAKPFDLGELIARVKALIRRSRGHASSVLTLGDLRLDMTGRLVTRGNIAIDLTPMEYRVLEYLLLRKGAVVPKSELLEHLYDYNWEKFSNVIEVYISGLRRKVDAGAEEPLIETVRGHGYVMRKPLS